MVVAQKIAQTLAGLQAEEREGLGRGVGTRRQPSNCARRSCRPEVGGANALGPLSKCWLCFKALKIFVAGGLGNVLA